MGNILIMSNLLIFSLDIAVGVVSKKLMMHFIVTCLTFWSTIQGFISCFELGLIFI